MDELFTTQEKGQVKALYRELRTAFPEPFEGSNYYLLKQSIVKSITSGNFSRDLFGFNPIVTSLQTALFVTHEIGSNKEAVWACLLAPYYHSGDDLSVVASCFNDGVATILKGIINIARLYDKSPSIESENFRNLIVSFAEDMRVILIMIASRTNLMRHLRDNVNTEARLRISSEAAYLYAPLAHKLGLYKVKSELEDLSLKYMDHDAYYHIKEKLNATKDARDAYMERFMQPIREMLDKAHLKYHMKGRTKSIHSIWQKMKRQGCPFEGVYDLFAIRIILDAPLSQEKMQCWQAYSLITDKYHPNPKRLRDWLSIPKSNGYESLHITVLGPENKWVEVQIRTERMDEIAEHGLAAHWRYKGIHQDGAGIENWLANIRSALESSDDMQLMDQFRSELKTDEVYIFTPHGDLHKLPQGATVLDFAYKIHSNLGDHCTGAIVNDKKVPLRHVLSSGDQVSIQTSPNQVPKLDWLSFVTTSKARSKIRQSLKEQEVKEARLAKEILERKFRNRKMDYDGNLMIQVAKKMGYKDANYFFKAVLDEVLDVNDVIDIYVELQKRELNQLERAPIHSAEEFSLTEDEVSKLSGNDELVIGSNIKGMEYTLAKCCHPIFGDDIFGFVTIDQGVKIHRASCPNANALRNRFGYRIIKARWAGKGENSTYPITLRIVGNDDLGVVNNISSIVSKDAKISIRSFSITADDGLFSGVLTVMISNTQSLDSLIKKLKSVKGVKNVSRS